MCGKRLRYVGNVISMWVMDWIHVKWLKHLSKTDIIDYTLKQKWGWAGRIARMKDNRWTKSCTEWQPSRGKRSRGRSSRRCHKERGNHQEQESNRQKTMENTAVDGQSLGDENTGPHNSDRIVGLVARRPPREREIPGSNPACDEIFFGVESYQ